MSKIKNKVIMAIAAGASWAGAAAAQVPLQSGQPVQEAPTMTILPAQFMRSLPNQSPVIILDDPNADPAKQNGAAAAPANGSCCGNNGCGDKACEECEPKCHKSGWLHRDLGDPWNILDLCEDACGKNRLKDNGWIFGGNMAWGYSNRPDGAFTGNGPFLSQKEWGNFNLNQMYTWLGKEVDGSKGFDWGFRADLIYGTDGNEAQAFGNVDPGHWDYLNGWDHGMYEWALPQLYGEVALGDLSIKAGHFYTNIGYEVVIASQGFFHSHQLTHYNSEPFTHTGVLATYAINDKLSVSGGWVLGWDTGFYQYRDGNSFIGGFTYNFNDDTSLTFGTVTGDLGWRGNGSVNSAYLTRKWSEKVSTVHQFDVLSTDLRLDDGTPANFRNPDSYTARNSTGFINYLFYDFSDVVKFGTRTEWYKADGTSYYTWTTGFNFFPMANLAIRPEVRYMWSPGNHDIYTGNDFNKQLFNQTVFGIDAVLTF